MNCNARAEENYTFEKGYDNPVLAGTLRFLLGLTLMFAGFYVVAFGDFQGHGLGFFLVFASPLIMFKDEKDHEKDHKEKPF